MCIGGATILDINTHLKPVKEAIWDARSKWRDIGRLLPGLTEGTIATIHDLDDNESLHKVLSLWMHSGNAMIQDILKALEHVTVSRVDIAKKIRALKGKDRTQLGL